MKTNSDKEEWEFGNGKREIFKMIYCRFDFDWEYFYKTRNENPIRMSKEQERKILALACIILSIKIGTSLLISESMLDRYMGIFFIGVAVCVLLCSIVMRKWILRRKYEHAKKQMGGKWIIEIWVKNEEFIIKNPTEKGELLHIPLEDIQGCGEFQDRYYISFGQKRVIQFPKNSFVEGDWKSMTEIIGDFLGAPLERKQKGD